MKRNQILAVPLALILAAWPRLQAAIAIVNPVGANHTGFSICPAVDGANQLDPDPAAYLPPPPAGQGVMAELANGNTPFPGWNFKVGAALNGTLTINYYHSKFVDDHFSGAKIKATYKPGAGDPASLRFVQMVDTSDPLNGATSPYIDPFPNDDTLPLYWTEKENKVFGLTFYDFSKRYHPPTSYVTWRGNLYLVDWDGKDPGTVTVHDGVRWGFDAGCIDVLDIFLTLTPPDDQNQLTLTWPSNPLGGQVVSTTSLDSPTWTPVTGTVTVSNNMNHLSVPATQSPQFFRLSFSNVNTGAPPASQPAYVRVPPQSQTVPQSHETYLSVKADGTQPIAYQWFFNGQPIPGATNRELDIPQTQYTHQGAYFVTVTNSAGGETSDIAQLTVIQDTNPPVLRSAAASTSRTQILVTFSEPVDPVTSQNPANYQVRGEFGPVQIINATAGTDLSTVTLTAAMPLAPNSGYFLQASPNITDLATPPNHLPAGSATTFMTGQ
jgi:hypothetical protein